jgi:hypothetical protein
MTEFEKALQECLYDVEEGNSSIDECLNRYPKYAQQLEPVLHTSVYLQYGSEARPSAAFKARVRSKLIQQMYAQPRKTARSNFILMRMAVSLAALVLALLVGGTAYAQGSLPGNAFFPWKLASENAWRTVSADPVGTDLAIAQRRMAELIAVSNDATLYTQALDRYLKVAEQLKTEINTQNEAHILTALDAQAKELSRSGIILPQTDPGVVPPSDSDEATSIHPTMTATPPPLPVLETPQINPTDLPEIVPTIQVPSKIVPTVAVPPRIIPTLEIPPLIP